MYGDYLMHYGVQGQKHGVRNYQNPDGSLTAAGRIHYGVGPAREKGSSPSGSVPKAVVKTRAEVRVEKAAARKQKAEEKEAVKKKAEEEKQQKAKEQAAKTKEDVIRSGDYNTIMKYKNQLTEDELKRAISRMATEVELSKYAPKTPEKKHALRDSGKAAASKIASEVGGGALKGVGKAATVVGGAVAVYYGQELVKKLVNDKNVSDMIFNEKIMDRLTTQLGQKLK